MALWLVRAGRNGEYEERFLTKESIYLTWQELQETDLSAATDRARIREIVQQAYPHKGASTVANWAGQISAFVLLMKPGDWIVLPRRRLASIAIGELIGPYRYDPAGESMYRHSRQVRWLDTSIPRTAFDQDLLHSFGAFMTVCQISRNDAEKRVRAMAKHGWRAKPLKSLFPD